MSSRRRPHTVAARSRSQAGYTFVEVMKLEPYVSSTPTSCQMRRPSGG